MCSEANFHLVDFHMYHCEFQTLLWWLVLSMFTQSEFLFCLLVLSIVGSEVVSQDSVQSLGYFLFLSCLVSRRIFIPLSIQYLLIWVLAILRSLPTFTLTLHSFEVIYQALIVFALCI